MSGLEAIVRTRLGHDARNMVAHRARRQMQRFRYRRGALPLKQLVTYLGFSFAQRIVRRQQAVSR